ncbi:Peroxisome chaperone and import receptor [Coemansia sp. Benny D160-2]|nr:Peroxisome chaperone and import receptor [Coemansia sp. Benny D160-2]
MANAPPNDDELDGLLDDAFAQFDTPLPKQQSQTQKKKKPADTQRSLEPLSSSKSTDKNALSDDTNFEEEFARQLAKGMEDLLKESSGSDADSNVNESEMKAAIDQLLKQMGTLQSDLASSSDKEAEKPDSAPKATASLPQQGAAQVDEKSTADSSGDAQTPSFQDKIKATMDKLKESADRADAETQGGLGDMVMLEELMRQMDGGGDDTQLDSLVDDVIGQLMSKEVLEQPLKDLDKQYPKYLDENKASLPTEDYERYQKQHDYIKQILALFEKLDDDSVNNELVVELMQKMQDCGQPPKELLKTLAPDMELDENGEVKVPEMPNCTIM